MKKNINSKNWIDETIYLSTVKEPNILSIGQTNVLEITIVKPDGSSNWEVTCFAVGLINVNLKVKTLKRAKVKAIIKVENRTKELLRNIKEQIEHLENIKSFTNRIKS